MATTWQQIKRGMTYHAIPPVHELKNKREASSFLSECKSGK